LAQWPAVASTLALMTLFHSQHFGIYDPPSVAAKKTIRIIWNNPCGAMNTTYAIKLKLFIQLLDHHAGIAYRRIQQGIKLLENHVTPHYLFDNL
jgi:hypothetical protein